MKRIEGYGFPIKEIRNIEFLNGVLKMIDDKKEIIKKEDIQKYNQQIEFDFAESTVEKLQEKFKDVTFVSFPFDNKILMEIEGEDLMETYEVYSDILSYLNMDNRIYPPLRYHC